jgi:hypothetical protein
MRTERAACAHRDVTAFEKLKKIDLKYPKHEADVDDDN